MTLVSNREFVRNDNKYLDLALDEEVCIERGDYMFRLVSIPIERQYPPQPVLEPDDDLRRAITMDELLEGVLEDIDKFFATK